MAKKILVIDDEEIIIRSLTKLFEKNNLDVYVAKNGQDAFAMAEGIKFDLIISDIRMPGDNGVIAIRKILENFKPEEHSLPPIIFITGFADKKLEEEARKLNPIAYIYKPFDILELLQNVKKILK